MMLTPKTIKLLKLSGLLLVISTFCVSWVILSRPTTFPIRTVEVIGIHEHIANEEIELAATPWVKTGFFSVPVHQLRDTLLAMPWVKNVEILRVWPKTIRIIVTEKLPIARWQSNRLMTEQGDVFTPTQRQFPRELPLLIGQDGQEKTVWKQFVTMQTKLMRYGLKISEMTLSARGDWSIRLQNHIELVLGRNDPEKRLARFTEAYPIVIGAHADDAERVDLRYPSGIAVKWREKLPAPEKAPESETLLAQVTSQSARGA